MKISRKHFLGLSGLAGAAVLMPGCDNILRQAEKQETGPGSKPDISYHKKKLELAHRWTISRGSADYKEDVFVEYSKDGIRGIGEASHMTGAGQNAEKTMKELDKIIPVYREADPFEFHDLAQRVNEIIPGSSPAKAAIDIALFDWIGKKLDIPLHRMFGLNRNKYVDTSFSIGYDEPDILKEKVDEAEPYSILKIKLTGKNDREVVNTIRRFTDKTLRVDINEAWTDREEAVRMVEWLAGRGVELVEQPMPVNMISETAWLKERSPLPIVADEAINTSSDIPSIAEAYDGINIKLMKSGGIMEAYRMAITAGAFGLDIMIGCMIASSVAISAAVQLQPLARWLDLDGSLLIKDDPYEGAAFSDGHWVMPERPGIGIYDI